MEDFDFAEDGVNTCPSNSQCITFEERYGDARGLCNQMWGNAFFYSEDEDNCTVMAFDGTMANPNFQLSFPTDAGQKVGVASWALLAGVVLAILMSAL